MKYGIPVFIGKTSACIVLGVILAAGTAWAHHGAGNVEDKPVTLTGTLTKIDWRNPHILLFVEIKGKNGEAESWVIDGDPPGRFAMRQIGKADFEKAIGRTVTVQVRLARDGSHSARLDKITLPDGRVA